MQVMPLAFVPIYRWVVTKVMCNVFGVDTGVSFPFKIDGFPLLSSAW